jgi:hypothetical protein
MEAALKEAPAPKMSEAIQVGGIMDTGKESFGVDILADVKAAAIEKPEAEKPGKTEQVADPPAAPEVETKGAKKDDKDTGEADDLKLTVKTDAEIDSDDDSNLPVGVRKRLNKMRWEKGETEREAERLRAENAALKAANEKAKIDSEEPDITKFETEAEYLKALTAYQVKKQLADKAVEDSKKSVDSAKEQDDREKAERHTAIQSSLKEAEKKYDDFKATVIDNKDLKITEQMVDIMMDLPNMGEIAYRLGKNPDLAAEIASMPLTKQAFALKDISDQIKSKKITKAPNPVRSIGATGGDIKALSDMTYAEYKKYMDKREQERRGG